MSMNNNTFVHLYSNTERSKTAANDFSGVWERMIVSAKSRPGIVEFTMVNNDVHVFLSYILYPQWCCGRTYYMDGILYRGEYPYNNPIQKENNMENHYTDMEIEKLRKDAYATAMEEAHEAMIKLYNLDYDANKNIFGYGYVDNIVKNYDIRTIIGRLHAYEQKRTMIGKEYVDTNNQQKVIVTNVVGYQYRDKYVYYLMQNGATEHLTEKNFSSKYKETGKSYPGLVAFLDKTEGSES